VEWRTKLIAQQSAEVMKMNVFKNILGKKDETF
jgi:hypothetical protein